MIVNIKDLPPNIQRQVLKKWAEDDARREAVPNNHATDRTRKALVGAGDFDSRGEYEYYTGQVLPRLQSGEITECVMQPVFELFGRGEYNGEKLNAIRYTADFKNTYADGTVEVVEVKSRFVKRMQRDYHIRRRMFIEKYARPNGWKFTEIISDAEKDKMKLQKDKMRNDRTD